jgi:hypothetical protein
MYDSGSTIKVFLQSRYQDVDIRWGARWKYFPISFTQVGDDWSDGTTLKGDLVIRPNRVYKVMVSVVDPGGFRIVFWDPENPDVRIETIQQMGGIWNNLKWQVKVRVSDGGISIQDLNKITFDGYK